MSQDYLTKKQTTISSSQKLTIEVLIKAPINDTNILKQSDVVGVDNSRI